MENLQKKIQFLLDLYKGRNLPKAESYCKELITYYPNAVILYNILGIILNEQRKINEAIECYKKGLKIKPDFAMIHNNLGSLYQYKENYNLAESYYKKSIKFNDKISEPLNNLGNLYSKLNNYSQAIECYKKAIIISPKFAVFYYNLGVTQKSLGDFKEAKINLEKAVKINKYLFVAHRTLSQLTKYTRETDHLKILQDMYIDAKVSEPQKAELTFSLGKAFDDIKDYKKAFKYYSEGNDLRRKNIKFNIIEERYEFNEIKKIFNKSTFTNLKNTGCEDATPIFILGMPRSGTTLVEQILSSHPNVYGADELNFFPEIVEKYFSNNFKSLSSANLSKTNNEEFEKIGAKYIEKLRKISKNKRITDKLPINFKWIGFIKLILPNAKIIHCVRNPKDNCFSIFKNYFANPKLNFAYNLNEITDFYLLYDDLMNHWKNLYPDFIFDIKYEEIIDNSEKKIRDLLKNCDLPWNDRCLQFYDNKRPIQTTSDTQVRKKIYNTSIDSWINYEDDLKHFFHKLTN
jgi:tetratricopeptide (TPR) repeat protein